MNEERLAIFRKRKGQFGSSVHAALLIGVLFSVFPKFTWGQSYFARHFTTEDGLPHNLCFNVNQDKNGTIWVCTDDGMARFDGDGFTRFGKAEGFTSTYPIMAINTARGTQLVAMWKGRICEFDGEKAWPAYPNSSSYINNMAVGNGAKVGIYKSGSSTFHIGEIVNDSLVMNSFRVIRNDTSGSETYLLSQDISKGNNLKGRPTILLSIHRDSLIFYSASSMGVRLLQADSSLQPLWPDIIKDEQIAAMSRSIDGSYWLGAKRKILQIQNGKLKSSIPIPRKETIKRIKVTATNKVVFSTYNNESSTSEGIYYLNPANHHLIPLHKSLGITSASTEFFIDQNQNLWIPTHGGGLYFIPLFQLDEFKHFPGQLINSITQTPNSNIWVSGIGGLSFFDKNLKETSIISKAEVGITGVNGNEIYYNFYGKSLLFSTLKKAPINSGIYSLTRWNTRWVGYDRFKIKFVNENLKIQEPTTSLSSININVAQVIDSQLIWFATDVGFRYFDQPSSDSIQLIIPDSEILKPLINMPIYDFQKSHHGYWWIAADEGLYAYYPDSALTLVGNRTILPFWSKAKLLEDLKGTLWIGTQKGLIRYNGSIFKGIDRRSGLISSEINAMCYSENGDLWLGTSKGVSILKNAQENIAFSHSKTPFSIHESSLDDKNSIEQGKDLSLSLKPKAILMAGLSKTQYKLDNGSWTYFTNPLTLKKIPSGKHNIQLRGRLAHTEWYELSPFSFQVKPWWQSTRWLSIISGTMLLGLLIGLYYSYRLKKEKAYNKRLQREITEREQAEAALGKIRQDIARDYHDELGNHLASITVLSSMAKKHLKAGRKETPEVLDKIADSSKQLHAITKDFLWSIEGKWHHLDELIVYLADKGNAFFEPLDIAFEMVKEDHESLHQKLPISVGRNVLLIFKEAMTNVGKYAQADSVRLQVSFHPDYWEISLENNGIEVPLKDKANSRGLANMRTRAQNIGADLLLQSNITRLRYDPHKATQVIQS